MKIAMIGTGYVGLVSGVCLAQLGHDVVCVDRDQAKIDLLRSGASPIYEPGIEDLVEQNVLHGRLAFSSELSSAVKSAQAVFIAVGTPSDPETGRADLQFVFAAARELAKVAAPNCVVVTKSTVPVGTNAKLQALFDEEAPGRGITVASNPEFLREGSAIEDFLRPDRIVFGTDRPRAARVMEEIYAPLRRQAFPILHTNLETAEMIKYAANAFLATKITFINEMSEICEAVGASVDDVSRGMGLDKRIGSAFLKAGPGYGGSCFPKDTSALLGIAEDAGSSSRIVHSVISSNDAQKRRMISKITRLAGGSVFGKKIAVFGVTFKPGTDDMRDAPSLTILPPLIEAGADIVIVDPQGRREGEGHFPQASWEADPVEAARDADAVVVLTEWDMFREVDLAEIASVMRTPALADLRNIYDVEAVRAAGFTEYDRVG